MTVAEKLKWVVLPSVLLIVIGILEVKHPHAMDGFDDGYTGRGATGLILLLYFKNLSTLKKWFHYG